MEPKYYIILVLATTLLIFLDDQVFIGVQIKRNRYIRIAFLFTIVLYYIFGITWISAGPSVNPVNPF